MADDTTLSTPVGTGDTIRDKDRAGVKTQIVGLDLGIGTGSEALMTGTMPVSGTVATGGLTDAQLRASAVPVSGTVTASGPLTDTQLRATPVPVGGTVIANPGRPGTATLANVAGSASSVTLQALNAGRLGWSVFNDSTAILRIKFGTTASATSFTVLVMPNAFYELPQPCYTGRIDGIWDSATGNARVTELTA